MHFNIGRCDTVPTHQTKKKSSGPVKIARTPENIGKVREALIRSLEQFARRHFHKLRLSRKLGRRILQKELKFQPYKLCVVQQLQTTDYKKREDFAVQVQVLFEDNEDTVIIMSNEYHFHLNGGVNKLNLRYWTSENYRDTHEKSLHSEHVKV